MFGLVFGYPEDWQLVNNTGTTNITFLMVLVIQNSQNRDSASVQFKFDELLRAIDAARSKMASLEDLPNEELVRLHADFGREFRAYSFFSHHTDQFHAACRSAGLKLMVSAGRWP